MQNRLETSLSQSCAIPLLEQLEPFQQELFQIFDRYVHPSYPLLGPKRPHKAAVAPTLKISICSVAHNIGLAAQKLKSDVFDDFSILGLPTEMRLAQLETIEAALLFQQRNAYNAGSVQTSLAAATLVDEYPGFLKSVEVTSRRAMYPFILPLLQRCRLTRCTVGRSHSRSRSQH